MTGMLRQTRALAQLVLRYWARSGLPHAVRKDEGRRLSGAILRGAFLLLMMNWGYRIGVACNEVHERHRVRALSWVMAGVFGFAVAWGMHARTPQLRQMQSPIQMPMLESLPILESSRVLVGMLERLLVFALAVSAVVGASPTVRGLTIGLLLPAVGLLAGDGLTRALRTVVSPERMARASFVGLFLQVPSLLVLGAGPMLAPSARAAKLVAPLAPLARAALRGEVVVVAVAGLAASAAFAAAAIRLAERAGYDRVDVVPTRRFAAASPRELTVEAVEHVLGRREPGGRWTPWFGVAYVTLTSVGTLAYAHMVSPTDDVSSVVKMVRGSAFLALLMAFSLALGRSTRMVLRDGAARAMLAPLPMVPSDLMRGKARALTMRALVVVAPFVVLVGVPRETDLRGEVVWRIGSMVLATFLVCIAVVSVAFLTQGLGSMRLLGAAMSVETTLVAMPLLAIASASSLPAAVVSTGCLAMLAFEARRSALRCLRWIDDGDDFSRETPVWRALLVFAAFQATQTFVQRAMSFAAFDEIVRQAVAYGFASVVLVAMTAYGQRGEAPIRLLPERRVWVAAGALLGAAVGALGLVLEGWLRARGVDVPPRATGGVPLAAVVLGSVVVAPIAEEIFFRGWLQEAVAADLGARRRWAAPLLTAFAFAAVHPFASFPALLALGLVSGLLYARTRSVGPGVAAYAVYAALSALVPR
jgi:membrane protease YdiL (CAAX protease family)